MRCDHEAVKIPSFCGESNKIHEKKKLRLTTGSTTEDPIRESFTGSRDSLTRILRYALLSLSLSLVALFQSLRDVFDFKEGAHDTDRPSETTVKELTCCFGVRERMWSNLRGQTVKKKI